MLSLDVIFQSSHTSVDLSTVFTFRFVFLGRVFAYLVLFEVLLVDVLLVAQVTLEQALLKQKNITNNTTYNSQVF